ncbi:MAG: hypothetical protein ACK6DC_15000 [Planctomycetota bacterium]|jgi:hypothetical protein
MRGLLLFWMTVLTIGALIGCGGNSSDARKEPIQMELEDLAAFLTALPTDGVKPPKNMEEFMPREPMAPMAADSLNRGELIYFWGADLRDGGESIIAYQKDAEANGGWVLLENGKVIRMTPEKFKSAPKAK